MGMNGLSFDFNLMTFAARLIMSGAIFPGDHSMVMMVMMMMVFIMFGNQFFVFFLIRV
jgi:hypothetical protein